MRVRSSYDAFVRVKHRTIHSLAVDTRGSRPREARGGKVGRSVRMDRRSRACGGGGVLTATCWHSSAGVCCRAWLVRIDCRHSSRAGETRPRPGRLRRKFGCFLFGCCSWGSAGGHRSQDSVAGLCVHGVVRWVLKLLWVPSAVAFGFILRAYLHGLLNVTNLFQHIIKESRLTGGSMLRV